MRQNFMVCQCPPAWFRLAAAIALAVLACPAAEPLVGDVGENGRDVQDSNLWSWVAAQIGFAERGPGRDRVQRTDRLRRLLGLRGVHARSPDADIEQAACGLVMNTAHSRARSWRSQ